jgi:hypothetical protein
VMWRPMAGPAREAEDCTSTPPGRGR